jgi:WD40 repeat protein
MESFNGHKDALLDLTVSPHSLQLIATSSDDKSIRIWNLMISVNAIKCYSGYGEPVGALLFHPKYDHLLLGATDSSILQFDLGSPGVLIRQQTILFQSASNEIACFAIHPKEDHLLAIGDDDGTIHLFNTQSQSTIKRLSRIHSNLLGKIAFNPINPNILISGGFDSVCCAWDLRRGRPASNLLNFATLNESHDSNLQIANPPFVHDLLHLLQGRIVVCALGDGKISLYKSSDGSLSSMSKMIDAHRGMVTNLASYPNPDSEASQTEEEGVRDYFLSAGADGLIKLWEVREVINEIESTGAPPPSSARGKKKKGTKEPAGRKAREWYEVIERSAIAHPNKVNSLCSVRRDDEVSIGVADVSSGWCLYRSPLGPIGMVGSAYVG